MLMLSPRLIKGVGVGKDLDVVRGACAVMRFHFVFTFRTVLGQIEGVVSRQFLLGVLSSVVILVGGHVHGRNLEVLQRGEDEIIFTRRYVTV